MKNCQQSTGVGWVVDVVFGVGMALMGAGCWGLWGWASAALVVGSMLVVLAVVGTVRGGNE